MSNTTIGVNFKVLVPDGTERQNIELVFTGSALLHLDRDGREIQVTKYLGGDFLVEPYYAASIVKRFGP